MSLAIKKILYAADAKGSALDEAQEYLNEVINGVEDEVEGEVEAETETWLLLQNDPGWYAQDICQVLGKQALVPSVMTKTSYPSPCHGHEVP